MDPSQLHASLGHTRPSIRAWVSPLRARNYKPSPLTHLPSSSVPAPRAPYNVLQGPVHLTFYDYGAPLPPGPAHAIVNTALTRIADEHGADRREKIGREVVYTLDLIEVAGTLRFLVEPESNMTWGMFAIAAAGVGRFLERWDNVEFTVDVSMWKEGPGKVGTVYMNRY